MKRRALLLASLALMAPCAALMVPAAAQAETKLDATLARIAKSRDRLKTLRAEFEQVRKIGLLATEVKSKGRLTLVMPDRLRWDLLPPDAVTYWIGPKGLAMRNAEGVSKVGKSAAGRFAAVLGDLRIMLGGDLRKLTKRYALTIAEGQGKDAGKSVITAVPKDKKLKKQVARLTLVTDPKAALIERIAITEKNGDQSIIRLSSFVKNKPVAPKDIAPPA